MSGDRFTMQPETFHDAAHGREWTRAVSEPLMWAQAKEYAAACRAGGHADWRLPEVGELWALVDHSAWNPATWPALRDITPPAGFWTATPYVPSSAYAWGVFFGNGYASYGGVAGAGRVRCVR